MFSAIKEVYCGTWYMGKRGRFGKCKRVGRWVWRKIRSRSKKTGGSGTKIEGKVEFKSGWI